MKKSLFTLTLMLLMAIGIDVHAQQNVCKIDGTEYPTLEAAVTAATDNQTIEIISAGNYTIPTINKNIVIKGNLDGVEFDCTGVGSIASIPNGATFENVTMNFGQNNYTGFQHSGHIIMNKCTLNGYFNSYGKMDFINCTFNQANEEYNMWLYAGDITFDGCKFNSNGKFLNLYNEGNDGGTPWKVVAKNCEFNSDKANKAALNIKETCGTIFLKYDVTINNCTCNDTQQSLENEITGTLYRISPIWQVDVIKEGESCISVTVNDKNEYPLPVAQIGEITYTSLADAITAVQEGETITMMADYILTKGLTITKDFEFTLDLNGKTVSIPETGFDFTANGTNKALRNGVPLRFAIVIDGKGTMNICDNSEGASGKIETQDYSYGTTKTILVDGNATVNLNSGTIKAGYAPFYVVGYTGTTPITDPTSVPKPILNVNGGKISGEELGIGIKGNTATLKVSAGEIYAKDSYAISTNGTQDWYDGGNFAIEITGGAIRCDKGMAMYLPAEGPTVITGGTIEGTTGIAVKGGSLKISNEAVVKAFGEKEEAEATFSGAANTGSCIYVEDTYSDHAPMVEIYGGKFSSVNNKSVEYFTTKADGAADKGKVTLSGGIYSDVPKAEYLAVGKVVTDNPDQATKTEYPYTVLPADEVKVAQIGEITYTSLADAIAAVQDDETINMIKDVYKAAGISVPSGKKFTVDFQGHSYSVECPGAGSAGTMTQAFQLLQGSTITFKNGTIKCTESNKDKTWNSSSESKGIAMIIQNYANLTLDNMTIDGTNIAHNGNPGTVRYIISNNSGNVTYSGNTNIIAPDGDYAFDVCKYGSYDAPTLTWKSSGVVDGFIELSGGELYVKVAVLKLTKPIKVVAKSTLQVSKKSIQPSDKWSGGDALIVVKRNGDLTIIGSNGTISNNGNANIYSAVKMTEKGEDDATNVAKLTVQGNVTLTGEYYGIVGNGNRHNTEIVVSGGTIKGVHDKDNVGIFHPQNGKLTITNGTIEGYSSAVEMRGGSITVTGGLLKSTAIDFSCNPNGSGNTTVGAALAIAQHTTKKDISVQISGGSFKGVKALNECNPQNNDPAPQVTMNVSGGMFNGEVTTADVKNILSGGIYSKKPEAEYLAIGKVVTENPDQETYAEYNYTVLPAADEVQVAPDLEIAPKEGEDPLTEEQKIKAKEVVNEAIDDMRENESAKLPEATKQINKEAVKESVLTTAQTVGINVEFNGVKVSAETESVVLKEFTFDVTPYVVETITIDEQQKSVSVKKIENEDIEAPMKFRLPIPSDVTDNCASIIHHKENGKDENMGLYSIVDNNNEKYVEISTPSFSKFDVVLKDLTAPTTLYYYAGNSEKIVATPNDFFNIKSTKLNAIAFVKSEYADWAKDPSNKNNIIVEYSVGESGHYYECPNFVLTDLRDFYTPVDFKALSGRYNRNDVYCLNSVCLPFAITNDEVKNGGIGVFHSTDMYNEDGTTYKNSGNIYLRYANNVAGGTPCVVQCEGTDAWEIDLTGKTIVSVVDNTHAFMGSYNEKTIGEGYFKVSDGKFVNTNSDSKVFPFRIYLNLKDIVPIDVEEESNAKELNITWIDDNDVTGIEEIKTNTINNKATAIIYDLTGRMVTKPVKGGLYIINGKKIIFR